MQLPRYRDYTPGIIGARKQPRPLTCWAMQPEAFNNRIGPHMTLQTPAKVSLFQQIATFFAGPDTAKSPKNSTHSSEQLTEVEVAIPLIPPTHFLDDHADAEEPADLVLIDLIPAGLSALNLPHYQAPRALDAQIWPACLINACRLEDRPLTAADMELAELAELIPAELSKLNIARAKAVIAIRENRVAPQPLPDLAKLKRAHSTSQLADPLAELQAA